MQPGQMTRNAPRAPGYVGADFYCYTVEILNLAAGGNGSGSFTVENDAAFELNKLTFLADLDGAAQTDSGRVIPLVNVLITATSSGRQLMNQAAPVAALFGDGRIPFILPRAKIFSPNSKVSISATNFSSATSYDLRLVFIGQKLYTP